MRFLARLLLVACLHFASGHTCGYLRDAYNTANGNTTTCCGQPGGAVVFAPEVQRVVFSFEIGKRDVLDLSHVDHATVDGTRFIVTILRHPGSAEQHLSRVGAFVLAQAIEEAYVPNVPQAISFDDFNADDRDRLSHAVGLTLGFMTITALAFPAP
jgi:hypothetical protein